MRAFGKIALPRVLAAAGVLAGAVGLLVWGEAVTEAARQAVEVCLSLLIPSLFPFFVASGLILACGYADWAAPVFAPLMRGLFGVGGACAPAFLLGLVGGYPVGARTAIALYRRGACTREEAERLLAFCNNSGPAFILGAVGTGILGSPMAGVLLYIAHILAGVSVGVVFRFWKGERVCVTGRGEEARDGASVVPCKSTEGFLGDGKRFLPCFLESVRSAGTSVLSICAFVLLFAVSNSLLLRSGVLGTLAQGLSLPLGRFGLDAAACERLLTGFMEVTAGLQSLAELSMSLTEKMAAASCMLGWAGLCVHCQVLGFLQDSGLSAKPYILGKLTQGALATLYIRGLVWAFPVQEASSVLLHLRLERLAEAGAAESALAAAAGALAVMWVVAVSGGWRRTTAQERKTPSEGAPHRQSARGV